MLPKILVCGVGGSKGQNWTENRVFRKYLKNASLEFFLFFGMKLDHNKRLHYCISGHATENSCLGGWEGQKVKIGPKIRVFQQIYLENASFEFF